MNIYTYIAVVFLIFLVAFEAIIYFPPWFLSNDPLFEVLNYNYTTIAYKVSSPSLYPADLRLVAFSVESLPPVYSDIYIYYDPTYQQASAQDNEAVQTVIDYISSELAGTGYEAKIRVVNASSLRTVLSEGSNPLDSLIVVPTGALPDTVYTLDKNLVKPWIEKGGTLIWIGSNIGYLSAERSTESPNHTLPRHPKYDGAISFFGQNIVIDKEWGAQALFDSNYSASLGLSYSQVSRGVSLAGIKSMDGLILGKTDDSSASIASLPLGKGRVVIFGGLMQGPGFTFLSDQLTIGKDIAQIIKSGVLASSDIIATDEIHVDGNGAITDSIPIGKGENLNTDLLVLYLFHPTPTAEGKFFKTVTLNLSKAH